MKLKTIKQNKIEGFMHLFKAMVLFFYIGALSTPLNIASKKKKNFWKWYKFFSTTMFIQLVETTILLLNYYPLSNKNSQTNF